MAKLAVKPEANIQSSPADAEAAFTREFNQRFAAYASGRAATDVSLQWKKEAFVKAYNDTLSQLYYGPQTAVDPQAVMSTEKLDAVLEGKAGIIPSMIKPLYLTLSLYGNDRDQFEKACTAGVAMGKRLAHEAWLASPAGVEETRKQAEAAAKERARREAEERMAANRIAWRMRNPSGMTDKPSMQEMIEAGHSNGEDFVKLLFDRVLPTWNQLSQVKFCQHVEALNSSQARAGKNTLTDSVLSSWHAGHSKPLRDSLRVICDAFDITPEAGEVMALHERMLWRAVDGHAFSYGGLSDEAALQKCIQDAKGEKADPTLSESGALVSELIDASGIRFERLQELLGVQQVPAWRKGAKIENVQKALDFLQLVGPMASPGHYTKEQNAQRREILSIITGREFDLDKIMDEALKAPNPGGDLAIRLTGRKGVVTVTTDELAKGISVSGDEVNEHHVKKMRTSSQLARGGKIFEPKARLIVDMVKARMQPLIDEGICEPMTEAQQSRALDILTRVEHPKKMLEKCEKGLMAIGAMVRDTCERKGLNHSGPNSFCEQVGISSISGFVLGKADVEPEVARKMAAWFKKNYDFTEQEQEKFIALAQGINLSRTPDMILADVATGTVDRVLGLRQIYSYKGMTREKLAEAADVAYHTIQYSLTEVSGGRIMAETDAVRRIGKCCGISEDKLDSFTELYDGKRVHRQIAIKRGTLEKEGGWQAKLGESDDTPSGEGPGSKR